MLKSGQLELPKIIDNPGVPLVFCRFPNKAVLSS